MTAASMLVSDDPYATAVRLLQVGAGLNMRQAGDLIVKLGPDAQAAFAAYANTDLTAAEAIDQFMSMDCRALAAFGLHDLADAVAESDPDRWS